MSSPAAGIVNEHHSSSCLNPSLNESPCATPAVSAPPAVVGINRRGELFCTEIFAPEHAVKGLGDYVNNRQLLAKSRVHLWDRHAGLRVRFLGGSEYVQNMVRGLTLSVDMSAEQMPNLFL